MLPHDDEFSLETEAHDAIYNAERLFRKSKCLLSPAIV
jgi:hypothetical protein